MFGIFENKLIENTQFLIDSVGEGLLIVNKDGLISAANTTAEQMLGYDHQEFIGWPCLKPFGALDEHGRVITKKNAALYFAIRDGKKTMNAIRQFLRKDGSHFWSAITVAPMIKRGENNGAIIVFRNITQEKLDQEYHADFARVASHQLRTPLGNVLWSVEFLLSEKPGKLSETQRETLEQTYQTLRGMNTLVNDLLSVSRLQEHRVKAKKEKVCIEDVLEKIIADLTAYAKANNIQITLRAAKRSKHRVVVEEHHLRTILQNIVENAIRYSFPKTTIVLELKKETDGVIFSCTNQGIGITEKSEKFIFAKFFRAKNAVEKQGDGTGLGMYITHELVQLYDGRIWFDSVPGKETTFFIFFKT